MIIADYSQKSRKTFLIYPVLVLCFLTKSVAKISLSLGNLPLVFSGLILYNHKSRKALFLGKIHIYIFSVFLYTKFLIVIFYENRAGLVCGRRAEIKGIKNPLG